MCVFACVCVYTLSSAEAVHLCMLQQSAFVWVGYSSNDRASTQAPLQWRISVALNACYHGNRQPAYRSDTQTMVSLSLFRALYVTFGLPPPCCSTPLSGFHSIFPFFLFLALIFIHSHHSNIPPPPPAFSRFSFSPTFLPLAHFIHVNLVAMPHISRLSSSIAYLFVASSSSPLSLHPPRPTRASSPLIPSVSISSFWPCFLSFAVSSVCSYTAKLWCSNKHKHTDKQEPPRYIRYSTQVIKKQGFLCPW